MVSDGSVDGEITVGTVHGVKHVPTHQSSVTDTAEVTLSVNNDATHLSRITTPSAGVWTTYLVTVWWVSGNARVGIE